MIKILLQPKNINIMFFTLYNLCNTIMFLKVEYHKYFIHAYNNLFQFHKIVFNKS